MKDIPIPIKMLASLMERPKSDRELRKELNTSHNVISNYTRILRQCGLVTVTKANRWYIYHYTPEGWNYIQDTLPEVIR